MRAWLFMRGACLVLICGFFLVAGAAAASRNTVITRSFPWQIAEGSSYAVYHYDPAGRDLLPFAEAALVDAHRTVHAVLPRQPRHPIPVFLYTTHNEFEQTTITDIGEGTGGVTEAFKNRLVVGHTGSQRYLAYVLNHEYMHAVEFEYLFSGFWRSLRLLKFIIYPNWLMEGLAEYGTGDADATTREMYLRDAALAGRLLPLAHLGSFNHLLPHQITLAYKESGALMAFIAREYGADKLPRLLTVFQDRFDADAVLLEVIGCNLATLDAKFRESLEGRYRSAAAGLSEPSAYGRRITAAGAYPRSYEQAVFSPDGTRLAWISDERGRPEIFMQEVASGAVRALWQGTRAVTPEYLRDDGRSLSFSPDGAVLAFAGEAGQQEYLYLFRMTDRRLERLHPHTATVASPAFSPDGGTIYFSGIRDGFRDLYAYNRATAATTRLTATPGDDIDAAVSPAGQLVYYATERQAASGIWEYDIAVLDRTTGSTRIVVALPGNERSPAVAPDGVTLYFTSDQDGINDLYRVNLASGQMERLTRVIGGIFSPCLSPDGSSMVFSSYRAGERHLYLSSVADLAPAPVAMAAVVVSSAPAITPRCPPAACTRPYRASFSTDLFFPALLYSSLDGLYVAGYWQASDMLGNHQVAALGSYGSAAAYVDYQAAYRFLKYRPQIQAVCSGREYYEDIDQTVRQEEAQQALAVAYPFNRFQQVQISAGRIDRHTVYEQVPAATRRTAEYQAGIAFLHDGTCGAWLEPTAGSRMEIAGQFADRVFCSDYQYQAYAVDYARYLPVRAERTLLVRMFGASSAGPDARLFRFGGLERVRGLSSALAGRTVLVNTLEWRFPLVYNINYHFGYLFPDLFFKSLYGTVFADNGWAWNDAPANATDASTTWKGGYGIGVRMHTFVMQMYTLLLHLQAARSSDGGTAIYLSAGSTF